MNRRQFNKTALATIPAALVAGTAGIAAESMTADQIKVDTGRIPGDCAFIATDINRDPVLVINQQGLWYREPGSTKMVLAPDAGTAYTHFMQWMEMALNPQIVINTPGNIQA